MVYTILTVSSQCLDQPRQVSQRLGQVVEALKVLDEGGCDGIPLMRDQLRHDMFDIKRVVGKRTQMCGNAIKREWINVMFRHSGPTTVSMHFRRSAGSNGFLR